MNEISEVTEIASIESEILELVADIPFENSHVQTRSVIDSALVPQKAFKVIGLRLMKRLQDLKHCGIKREQAMVSVELLRYEIDRLPIKYKASLRIIDLHTRRIELEIKEIESGFSYEDKLAEDCKAELSYLYASIKKMPKYTREEFEAGEEIWIAKKLFCAREGLPEPTTKGLARIIEDGDVKKLGTNGVVRITT